MNKYKYILTVNGCLWDVVSTSLIQMTDGLVRIVETGLGTHDYRSIYRHQVVYIPLGVGRIYIECQCLTFVLGCQFMIQVIVSVQNRTELCASGLEFGFRSLARSGRSPESRDFLYGFFILIQPAIECVNIRCRN